MSRMQIRLQHLERLSASSDLMRMRLDPTIRALRLQLSDPYRVARAPTAMLGRYRHNVTRVHEVRL
jgi:hypothetical protein